MKKRIMAIAVIMIILFTNYAFAVETPTYERTGGDNLSTIATVLTNTVRVDGKYNAVSAANRTSNKGVVVYDYGTTKEKTSTGNNTPIYFTDDNSKYYLTADVMNDGTQALRYSTRLKATEEKISNVVTVLYKNAITFNENKYNVKINVKEIKKIGDKEQTVTVNLGRRDNSSANEYDLSTYTKDFWPEIGVGAVTDSTNKVEIKVEYVIEDNNGNAVPVSGIFGIDDIDLNQGIAVENFVANDKNTYMDAVIDTIKYKSINSNTGTYFYSSTDLNLTNADNAYILVDEKSKIDLTFTFDTKPAWSPLAFINVAKIVRKHKVITKVTGGKITKSITNIEDGGNATISYQPNDADKQYLKSIKVDGSAVSLDTYKNSYAFTNITADHTIEVVYGDKLKVTHDPKGGAPTPAIQYVEPNGKATKPTDPTKEGYTFEGWKKQGETTNYNYTTPVTEDITLEADWTPIKYKITYVTNGGVNDPDNPGEYTVEDTINFKNPTREGYNFLGWYEDENFTKPKAGISHETGDKIVYAKWEAKTGVAYKVEHYKETTDGNYELAVSDNLTGTVNETVTATPKVFPGFEENTTHSDRIPTGEVKEDGSLVLKLYYNKIKHTVTFDPKNDTKIDDQIVDHGDKATEPTKPVKEGYTFEYWYYINDEGQEVRYNFDDPVTRDIDLIGKWEKDPEPEKPAEETPKKETKTPEKKVLPKTGNKTMVFAIGTMALAVAAVSGVKYIKIKRKMK